MGTLYLASEKFVKEQFNNNALTRLYEHLYDTVQNRVQKHIPNKSPEILADITGCLIKENDPTPKQNWSKLTLLNVINHFTLMNHREFEAMTLNAFHEIDKNKRSAEALQLVHENHSLTKP